MTHEPQHPDNPYRAELPEVERVPAKIWELLRRNVTFEKAVARLAVLDGRVKAVTKEIQEFLNRGVKPGEGSPDSEHLSLKCRERIEAKFLASSVLENVGKRHPFAAAALQWLVPEPYFEIRHTVIADGVDLTVKAWAPTKTIKIEGGETPDPKEWQTWTAQREISADARRSNAGCSPMIRGPHIQFTVPEHPLLQGSKVNGIQEWRDYIASHGPFTLNDSWRDTPPGFKRIFCWLWRQRDSREKNPLTDCRTDAPQEHETNFFQNWRLMEAIGRAARTSQLTTEDFARSLWFNDLAENYRVFAFPNSIRTRTEARRLANWLYEQLTRLSEGTELPAREREILGSSLLWDMLLYYEDRRQQGKEHLSALRYTFDNLYLRLPSIRTHAVQPVEPSLDAALQHSVAKEVLIEAESTRWHSWMDDFARIHSPTSGQGLVQLIFPSLQAAIAKSSSPSVT